MFVVHRSWIAAGRGFRHRKGRRDAHSAQRKWAEREHSDGNRSSSGMPGCASADGAPGRNRTASTRPHAARVNATTGRCDRPPPDRRSRSSRRPGRPRKLRAPGRFDGSSESCFSNTLWSMRSRCREGTWKRGERPGEPLAHCTEYASAPSRSARTVSSVTPSRFAGGGEGAWVHGGG